MNKVHIVTSSLVPMLGIESATISLAVALSSRYEVEIATLADDAPVDLGKAVNVSSWGPRVHGWKRMLTVLRAANKPQLSNASVIILSGAWAAIPFLVLARSRTLKKTIVWEHSFDASKVHNDKALLILRYAARLLYRRASYIVAVSSSLKRDMLKAGFKQPIHVIPNLIRTPDEDTNEPIIPGRLVSIGRLVAIKNYPLALEALARLPAKFTLDILGDGPEREALERLASDLALADRVTFHGHVEDTARYLSRSQLLLHPSLGETFGLVLYEAAQMRRPVVAVNCSVMAEIVPGDVPGLLSEATPDGLSSCIEWLASHPVSDEEFERASVRRNANSVTTLERWNSVLVRISEGADNAS